MEKILDEYYNHGNITIHFVKLQLHIDLLLIKRTLIMTIYQANPVRRRERGNLEDDKIQSLDRCTASLLSELI